MNESENAALRHEYGVDSSGRLLTDERRAERAQEVSDLVQRASDLRSQLLIIDRGIKEIHEQSARDGVDRSAELGELDRQRNQLESEMRKIRDDVYEKSSTFYPAEPEIIS